MQDMTFRTFAEYVDVVGRNTPTGSAASIFAFRDYFQSLGEKRPLTRNKERDASRTISMIVWHGGPINPRIALTVAYEVKAASNRPFEVLGQCTPTAKQG
jgi:hypothetical protein